MSEANASAIPHEPPDVTVTTKPFALTPKVYFRILLRITYWNAWWRLAIIAVFMAYCLFLCCFKDEGVRFGGLLGVVISGSLLIFGSLYCYFKNRSIAHHPANKVVMKMSQITLSKKRIVANELENGNVAMYDKSDIFAIEQCKGYFLLWLTPHLMLYLAKDAFQDQDDLTTFEEKILPEYPQLKRRLRSGIFYIIAILGSVLFFVWAVTALNKP